MSQSPTVFGEALSPFQAGSALHPGFEISEQAADDAPLGVVANFEVALRIDPHQRVLADAGVAQGVHFLIVDQLEQGLARHLDEFHAVARSPVLAQNNNEGTALRLAPQNKIRTDHSAPIIIEAPLEKSL